MAICQSADSSCGSSPNRCQSPGSGFTLQPTSDRIMASRPISMLTASQARVADGPAPMKAVLVVTLPPLLPTLKQFDGCTERNCRKLSSTVCPIGWQYGEPERRCSLVYAVAMLSSNARFVLLLRTKYFK